MNKIKLILFTCMTLLTAQIFAGSYNSDNKKLDSIHAKIIKKYPNVKHLNAAEFVQLDQDKLALFDVRETDEYAVSHLKNAIQIDPDTKIEIFLEHYSKHFHNKTIVLYCSVGERSSNFASALNKSLEINGAEESFNLAGGLFQWHNEKRELMQEDTETKLIHPYNRYWGRLIDDKNSISYQPEDKTIELE